MSKCKKCGCSTYNGELLCPGCRKKIKDGVGGAVNGTFNLFKRTADYSAAYSTMDIEENRIAAILCYIPLLFLYPLIFKVRKSPYVRFHANQGVLFLLAELIVSVVTGLIGMIPIVNVILSIPLGILSFLAGAAFFALRIYCIVMAALGKAKELPFIGRIRIIR